MWTLVIINNNMNIHLFIHVYISIANISANLFLHIIVNDPSCIWVTQKDGAMVQQQTGIPAEVRALSMPNSSENFTTNGRWIFCLEHTWIGLC